MRTTLLLLLFSSHIIGNLEDSVTDMDEAIGLMRNPEDIVNNTILVQLNDLLANVTEKLPYCKMFIARGGIEALSEWLDFLIYKNQTGDTDYVHKNHVVFIYQLVNGATKLSEEFCQQIINKGFLEMFVGVFVTPIFLNDQDFTNDLFLEGMFIIENVCNYNKLVSLVNEVFAKLFGTELNELKIRYDSFSGNFSKLAAARLLAQRDLTIVYEGKVAGDFEQFDAIEPELLQLVQLLLPLEMKYDGTLEVPLKSGYFGISKHVRTDSLLQYFNYLLLSQTNREILCETDITQFYTTRLTLCGYSSAESDTTDTTDNCLANVRGLMALAQSCTRYNYTIVKALSRFGFPRDLAEENNKEIMEESYLIAHVLSQDSLLFGADLYFDSDRYGIKPRSRLILIPSITDRPNTADCCFANGKLLLVFPVCIFLLLFKAL